MKIVILGSGTSTGVPEVGCGCVVCNSSNIKDKRRRTSALVITDSGKNILIDCGPDFRSQALDVGLSKVDAILITHEHYDHVYGLDDLRTLASTKEIPIYAKKDVLQSIKNRMHYVFCDNPYPGVPKFSLNEINTEAFNVFDTHITPINILHGKSEILGFRFGNEFCYITDMKYLPKEQDFKLKNVPLIIMNALRYRKEHPSHQSIIDVFNLIDELHLNDSNIVLTHLSHHAPLYCNLVNILPDKIKPAYDNMSINISNGIVLFEENKYSESDPFKIIDCGKIKYSEALSMQQNIFDTIINNKHNNINNVNNCTVLFCEHNPVFTLGLHGKNSNMLMSKDFLEKNGYEYFEINRGGDITYHGPGQITCYPIIDLERFNIGIKKYIDILEDSVIDLLKLYNIIGTKDPKATGVWIDVGTSSARKICAIGVRCSRFVTMHGLALNVNNPLEPFSLINPCGFINGRVTSISKEYGSDVDYTVVVSQLSNIMYNKFKKLLK